MGTRDIAVSNTIDNVRTPNFDILFDLRFLTYKKATTGIKIEYPLSWYVDDNDPGNDEII